MIRKIAILLGCFLIVSSCRQHFFVNDASYLDYRFDEKEKVVADPNVSELIHPYKVDMESKMNEVLGVLAIDLQKKQPEGSMNNFVADAIRYMGEQYSGMPIDISIHNYGGMRVKMVSKGEVTLGNIYELIPFDNSLVALKIKGEVLQTFCDYIAGRGGWPVSESLRFVMLDGKADQIKVHGQPLDRQKEYSLVTIDYLANGGDYCDFLKGIPHENLGVFTRDALAAYIRTVSARNETIQVKLDKRISRK
jgi:2',3'-cyclic-nucleotide 2'-phosphodiesterase (5'-nucleotidase family)